MSKERLKVGTGKLQRSLKLERAALDEGKRTVPITFSSEAPVIRGFWIDGRGYLRGKEILSHDDGACDLTRLNNSHPLLVNHNDDDQVGVVDSAAIQDKTGRATVRFGESDRAEEIFRDVKSGIRPFISVGYRINAMKVEEDDCEDPMDAECEDRVFRATSWTPYEVSSVPIPADTNARTRAAGEPEQCEMEVEFSPKGQRMLKRNIQFEALPQGGGGGTPPAPAPAPAPQILNDSPAILAAERVRAKAIRNVGKLFSQTEEDVDRAIEQGLSEEAFNKMVLNGFRAKAAPTPALDEKKTDNRSVGERVTASEDYRKFAKKMRGGAAPENSNWSMEMEDLMDLRSTRAVAVETGLTAIQKQPGVVTLGQQPLTIADLLAPGETAGLTVRYIQENSFTNAATAVAENAAFPEATFDLNEIDATVRKIAVIGRVSNEMNEDFPAVRSYIDNRLAFMVGALEDNHLLNGTNANNQIKGILNFAGISTQAQGGNSVADAIFLAMTKVRAVGFFEPSAIVMHPNNFASLKLTKDAAGQYLFGGPYTGPYGNGAYSAAGFVWGLPVVATTAIAAGTILVGGFAQGGQLFRRRGLTIEFSNSDASDFANDRVAIRASTRIALAVYRPLAFCTVTGVA